MGMSRSPPALRVYCMTKQIRAFALVLAFAGTACKSKNPVTPPSVASVTLNEGTATLIVGENVSLVATPRDASGTVLTGRSVAWKSSAPAIATVSNGLVTAVSAGLATITATSEGESATAQITVNTPPATCAATSATGRLEYRLVDDTWRYTTQGGWTVTIAGIATVTIVNPHYGVNGTKLEFWGDLSGQPGVPSFGHENMNGKHIKDRIGNQRTIHTLDGAIITLNASPNLGRISIYDHDQTHRLERVGTSLAVSRSCAHAFFEEELEPDGEASGFVIDGEGYWWKNLYDQGVTGAGSPGPKVPNVVPLARVNEANPNQVNDYYDDPRLGHT